MCLLDVRIAAGFHFKFCCPADRAGVRVECQLRIIRDSAAVFPVNNSLHHCRRMNRALSQRQ